MQGKSGNLGTGGSQSGTGLAPNVAGALSYVLGPITGVLFVLLERNSYVRFHAFQSILVSVAWIVFWIAYTIVMGIFSMVPVLGFLVAILGFLISLVLGLGGLILFIMLIVKAAQGERWKLPYVGNMAESYASS